MVPIYVFPEMKLLFPKQNYNVLSPGSYIYISVVDVYGTPTKRQVSQRKVSKCLVSKRQVYKTSG